MCGVRAANPANREKFHRPVAFYWYADRESCGDGWYFGALASVAYQNGIAFRQPYTYGSTTVDFTDEDNNEQITARTWCRTGIPAGMREQTIATHPLEDGAMFEFDGGTTELLKILAAGGGFNTGGTNTSGGHKPYTVGRVGGHEQSCVGALNSEAWRKFSKDVIGVTLAEDDFAVIMNQTWGEGFAGEVSDQYWPAWLGHKPQGAWIWRAKQILQYFGGDIWGVLPRFKGITDPNPTPPPGPGPGPEPPPFAMNLTFPQAVPAGRYVLVKDPLA